jgi:hypothetical protein
MLAEILRQRGYDAIQVWELGRTGKNDAEQLVLRCQPEALVNNLQENLC